MFSLKLRTKIVMGFVIVLAIAMISSGITIFNMGTVRESSNNLDQIFIPTLKDSLRLRQHVLSIQGAVNDFDFDMGLEKSYLEQAAQDINAIEAAIAALHSLATQHPGELNAVITVLNEAAPLLAKTKGLLQKIEKVSDTMLISRQAMDTSFATINELLSKFLADKRAELTSALSRAADHGLLSVMNNNILNADLALTSMLTANSNIQTTLAFDDYELHAQAVTGAAEAIAVIKRMQNEDAAQAAVLGAMLEAAQDFHRHAVIHYSLFTSDNTGAHEEWNGVTASLLDAFAKVQDIAMEITESNTRSFIGEMRFNQNLLMLGALLAAVLGGLLAFFITRSIIRPVKATMDSLKMLSNNDFAVDVNPVMLARKDELGEMMRDVKALSGNLCASIMQLAGAAHTVTLAANEIVSGNRDLNHHTQNQAGSVEETSSTLEEITSSVQNNAASAGEANQIAQDAMRVARDGDEMLKNTVAAMDEVSQASSKITDIVGVVNEIAFQTNLLALNASVEAARAGEAGRGFAVVAGEVRTLAGRTASASKEIQELIMDSSQKIAQGHSMVNESNNILHRITESVTKLAASIGQISSTSLQQAQSIAEINNAVHQMDQTVQQNATLVENAGVSSESMLNAARQMQDELDKFHIEPKGKAIALLTD